MQRIRSDTRGSPAERREAHPVGAWWPMVRHATRITRTHSEPARCVLLRSS
jgi:hypothetical protein